MKKSMKKLFTILFVLLFACRIFAAEGVVTFVKGKVEVKRGNTWVALKVGDKVAQSEVINTGFQSEAKVKLMNNVLYLGPVTRVTLSTLSESNDRDKVNVYLSTGTIRSKVNRTDTKRVSYTVRTPIAVASVRGTDVINEGPKLVECLEGRVGVTNIERLSTKKKPSKDDKKADDDDLEDKKDDLEDEAEDAAEDAAESKEETSDESKEETKSEPKSEPLPEVEEPKLSDEELEKIIENIIEENLDKFGDGDTIPGGEQSITKNQQIFVEEYIGLDNGKSNIENTITDTTSKVAPTSNKEGTKTETPTSSKPIVDEVVSDTPYGSILVYIYN